MIDKIGTLRKLATAADGTALASVLGALDDAQATGPTTGAETAIALLRQTVEYLRDTHTHHFILFVIPEAVGSINADNTAIQTELQKLCHVHTITQADALEYPNFTMYSLCVLGTNSGTAWTTANMAHIRTIPQLPILCFDKVSAAYFEIGTDGGDAAAKTAIDVVDNIEGSLFGIGGSEATGLDAGANTVTSSATYHTLDMSNANITEDVYATETEDVDGGTANTDVVLGKISGIQEDGSIGIDESGTEVPATLIFFGAGYEAAKLNSLGLAVIHNICHYLIHAQAKPSEIAGTVQNLRRLLIGNMGGQFSNTAPLVEWLVGQNTAGTKLPVGTSLYDILDTVDTVVDGIQTDLSNGTDGLGALKALIDTLTTNVGTIDTVVDGIQTDLSNGTDGLGALKALIDAITAAGPTLTQMNTAHALLATVAKQDIIDGNVDDIEALVDKKVSGRLQMHKYQTDLDSTTVNTYATETAVTQDIIIEGIVCYCHRDMTGEASFTGFSVATDASTPYEFISQADGVRANMGAESQISWTGHMLLKQGTYLTFTTYGGTVSAVASLWDWYITFRSFGDGGYIA